MREGFKIFGVLEMDQDLFLCFFNGVGYIVTRIDNHPRVVRRRPVPDIQNLILRQSMRRQKKYEKKNRQGCNFNNPVHHRLGLYKFSRIYQIYQGISTMIWKMY